MERVSRVWFTPQQKAELWERWKSGQCIASIARTLGRRNKSGVYRILALNGGIMAHLRTRRQLRQAKGGVTRSGLGQIVDTISIRERPAEVPFTMVCIGSFGCYTQGVFSEMPVAFGAFFREAIRFFTHMSLVRPRQ